MTSDSRTTFFENYWVLMVCPVGIWIIKWRLITIFHDRLSASAACSYETVLCLWCVQRYNTSGGMDVSKVLIIICFMGQKICIYGSICMLCKDNSLRPRRNRHHVADDSFICIFLNETLSISIRISPKFIPKGPSNNIPALVQMMDWRRLGDQPLTEAIMVTLPTHICVTRFRYLKCLVNKLKYFYCDVVDNTLLLVKVVTWLLAQRP